MNHTDQHGPALVVRGTGQRIPLTGDRTTIGRQAGNPIVLADSLVSRQHAAIVYQAGAYAIQDLGSANGTYVNGRRVVGTQVLQDGDAIRIGNATIDVRLAAGAGPTVMAARPGPPAMAYGAASQPGYQPRAASSRTSRLPLLLGLLVGGLIVAAIAVGLVLLLGQDRGEAIVTILSPAPGAQVSLSSLITLQASATGVRDLTRLELLVDDVSVAAVTSPDPAGSSSLTVSQEWTFDRASTHVVLARAYTARGDVPTPVAVSVIVGESLAQVTPSPAPAQETPPPTDSPSSALPSPATASPTVPPPTAASSTAQPPTAASSTAPPPTAAPPSGEASRPAAPGPITGFETFGRWARGDQPNGTFVQTSEQVHGGTYAGKLAYSFPGAGNDYVVFLQTYELGGQPNQISAWVYGDGVGSYLNFWIQDAQGETWQFPLGQVKHTGWQQMVARLDPAAAWPAGHIDGPSNGAIDYPIDFRALVLDDAPDTYAGTGAIFVDDLRSDEASQPAPAPSPTPQPTAQPPNAPAPVIQFWADDTMLEAGESTILHWHVENVQEIYLDDEPVTGPDGQREVQPEQTTTYRLRVVHQAGEETLEVTLTVPTST
ncbi:MAG: FHA domain-containing protein, partial [Anaerolineae bacterium]